MKTEIAENLLGMFEDILKRKGNLNLTSEEYDLNFEKGDEADIAGVTREQSLNQRLSSREMNYVKKVKAAKDRILNGTYGICEDCGADISHARLLARPTASLCISCKEEQEADERLNINKRRDLKGSLKASEELSDNIIKTDKFKKFKDIKFESIVENF
jgi:DnaK suppressor protein